MSAIPFRSSDDQFYRYIRVNFMFGLLDCDCYIRNIVIPWTVKPRLCSIHYTVTLARLKNVNCYIENIVLSQIIMSGFHCIIKQIFLEDYTEAAPNASVLTSIGEVLPTTLIKIYFNLTNKLARLFSEYFKFK